MWSVRSLVLVVLFSTSVICKGQEIRNLVFEGAGIRGVAYVGAIQSLYDHHKLDSIEKIGGTSAGAIAALTVALGYSPSEIENIIYNTKLQKFNDGKFFFIGGITRLNRSYGWYKGKAFTKWLENIISKKTGNANITFDELHAAGYPDLYITGTSLNHQRMILFSRENYPAMKIKDAVRITMSIPLYFQAVCIDQKGQVKSRKDWKPEYDLMVDGGFTANFPITIFDSLDAEDNRIPNAHTVGLRIDTPDQIEFDKSKQGLAPIEIHRFRNYIGAFYSYVIENLNRQTLTSSDWKRTISISSGTIGPKIKKLSREEKNLLIRNGSTAAQQFISLR